MCTDFNAICKYAECSRPLTISGQRSIALGRPPLTRGLRARMCRTPFGNRCNPCGLQLQDLPPRGHEQVFADFLRNAKAGADSSKQMMLKSFIILRIYTSSLRVIRGSAMLSLPPSQRTQSRFRHTNKWERSSPWGRLSRCI